MMQLTDYSPQLCQELGLSGFVALLKGFLECLADQLLVNTVSYMAWLAAVCLCHIILGRRFSSDFNDSDYSLKLCK